MHAAVSRHHEILQESRLHEGGAEEKLHDDALRVSWWERLVCRLCIRAWQCCASIFARSYNCQR